MRSTAAPYTESRLTRSVANERVGFPVVERYVRHRGPFKVTQRAVQGDTEGRSNLTQRAVQGRPARPLGPLVKVEEESNKRKMSES